MPDRCLSTATLLAFLAASLGAQSGTTPAPAQPSSQPSARRSSQQPPIRTGVNLVRVDVYPTASGGVAVMVIEESLRRNRPWGSRSTFMLDEREQMYDACYPKTVGEAGRSYSALAWEMIRRKRERASATPTACGLATMDNDQFFRDLLADANRLDESSGPLWIAAEMALAPLAPGDYAIEVSFRSGGVEQRVLTAIRLGR